jgi:large subunit ribosomal protein L25
MKTFELNATERKESGKKASKHCRKEGLVPCVLYGNGLDNVFFTVEEKALQHLIYTPEVYVVMLNISGKTYKTILHEIQFHPVSDKALHIDFLNIVDDKPVQMYVPVVISGNSEGVKLGGKLQVVARKLKISALPKDLPDNLPVDITGLGLGKAIVAGELSYPNIELLTPRQSPVCRIKVTRASREQAAEAAK